MSVLVPAISRALTAKKKGTDLRSKNITEKNKFYDSTGFWHLITYDYHKASAGVGFFKEAVGG